MLALDHLVISSKNSLKSSERFAEKNEIQTVIGGVHENWGTKNILAYFANDCYIEWIEIEDENIANQSNNPLIQHLVSVIANSREETFQFALRTNRMDQVKEHFLRKNIPHLGPLEGSRKTVAGATLTWRMLFPLYDYEYETLPFLIEWNQPLNERIQQSKQNDNKISSIVFSNVSIERFASIYPIDKKLINGNVITLTNCQLIFSSSASGESIQFKLS